MTWTNHCYRAGSHEFDSEISPEDLLKHRAILEPWLTALWQSEHLSLLLGSGFTRAAASALGAAATTMQPLTLDCELGPQVLTYAAHLAELSRRQTPSIEDQLRSATQLLEGLRVQDDSRVGDLENALQDLLVRFIDSVLETERNIAKALAHEQMDAEEDVTGLLMSFLLSLASRTPSRERLHIFTTNYDRLIEHICDLVGVRVLDEFVGALQPILRTSRLAIDIHYNPPGIRGEPRYLEGVVRLSKLHGSLDWRWDKQGVRRFSIPFGAASTHSDLVGSPLYRAVVYPNASKERSLQEQPYSELFRDFANAVCRPNGVLVTYGYGFGDDHVNRIINDMLTIPSTHLVLISYDDADGRVSSFYRHVRRNSQVTLLLGSHFANLPELVRNYWPKPAIDRVTIRMAHLLSERMPFSIDAGKIQKDGASDD